MGAFLTSLGAGVVIPVVTAIAAAAWKLLGKNDWTADDFLLAFELLIAALCVQLTFLGGDFAEAARPGPPNTDHLMAQITARVGLLAIVGLLVLPSFAVGMRYHTRHQSLTETVAIRVSVVSGGVLVVIFFVNYYLAAAL
jgi:hypothetical protein